MASPVLVNEPKINTDYTADARQQNPAPEEQSSNLIRLSPERHSNANFPPPLSDRIGKDASGRWTTTPVALLPYEIGYVERRNSIK